MRCVMDNKEYSKINPIIGIPHVPILVLESLTKSSVSPFVARNSVWGGVALVASSNAAERAARTLLRPTSNTIELGPYEYGKYDILAQLQSSDGYMRHNGIIVRSNRNKIEYVAKLCRQLHIKRATLHFHTSQLISAMERMGLEVRESLQVYQNLGKKGALNSALEIFSRRCKTSTIGKFGQLVNSLDDITNEVYRLASFGVRACVKLDGVTHGAVSDSGSDVYFIPDVHAFHSQMEFKTYMKQQLILRNYYSRRLSGVVQIYVPKGTVISVSSGQNEKGEYVIYEAHTQIQIPYMIGQGQGLTADGAVPLENNNYTREFFDVIWPQLVRFYYDNNVTGDQNMNLVILPPNILSVAREIYGNTRLSAIVAIDLNPRPISGTKRVMGRFTEETFEKINFKNFAARSLHIHPMFAANPHLIFMVAATLGLHAGKHGNMSLINFGNLIPERIRKSEQIYIKIYIQNVFNPINVLSKLEELISRAPAISITKKVETKKPEEIPDANRDVEYELWLTKQLAIFFERSI